MKRMNNEGAMSWKGLIIVGLALIVVCTLVVVGLANTNIITGNNIIYEGRYELSDPLPLALGNETYARFDAMNNGEEVVYRQSSAGSYSNYDIMRYNIADDTTATIFEWNNVTLQNPMEIYLQDTNLAYITYNETGDDYWVYYYDMVENETTFLTNFSGAVPTDVRVYDNTVVFREGTATDFILWAVDIRTLEAYELDILPRAVYDLRSFTMYENQVVYAVQDLSNSSTVLKRVNILNPHPVWIFDPEEYQNFNFDLPSMWGDKVACIFTPPYLTGYTVLVENITSQNPTYRRLSYEDPMHDGWLESPNMYENFIIWFKYDLSYTSGWMYLYDMDYNATWRIYKPIDSWQGSRQLPWIYDGLIDFEILDHTTGGNVIYCMRIGAYNREMIAPELQQTANLDGMYLLGITATLLVAILATELIMEGGLPSIGVPRRMGGKIALNRNKKNDYYEE